MTSTIVMSGLSLVPVMVTVTVVVVKSASCPVRSGELSRTLTLYVSSSDSPAARNSNPLFPPTEPGPDAPEVNVQVKSLPLGVFAAKADVPPVALRASIPSRSLSLRGMLLARLYPVRVV